MKYNCKILTSYSGQFVRVLSRSNCMCMCMCMQLLTADQTNFSLKRAKITRPNSRQLSWPRLHEYKVASFWCNQQFREVGLGRSWTRGDNFAWWCEIPAAHWYICKIAYLLQWSVCQSLVKIELHVDVHAATHCRSNELKSEEGKDHKT